MNDIMQHFTYEHLPEDLQKVSRPVCELAQEMMTELGPGRECSAGLRKLLEAKDCFVRQAIENRDKIED